MGGALSAEEEAQLKTSRLPFAVSQIGDFRPEDCPFCATRVRDMEYMDSERGRLKDELDVLVGSVPKDARAALQRYMEVSSRRTTSSAEALQWETGGAGSARGCVACSTTEARLKEAAQVIGGLSARVATLIRFHAAYALNIESAMVRERDPRSLRSSHAAATRLSLVCGMCLANTAAADIGIMAISPSQRSITNGQEFDEDDASAPSRATSLPHDALSRVVDGGEGDSNGHCRGNMLAVGSAQEVDAGSLATSGVSFIEMSPANGPERPLVRGRGGDGGYYSRGDWSHHSTPLCGAADGEVDMGAYRMLPTAVAAHSQQHPYQLSLPHELDGDGDQEAVRQQTDGKDQDGDEDEFVPSPAVPRPRTDGPPDLSLPDRMPSLPSGLVSGNNGTAQSQGESRRGASCGSGAELTSECGTFVSAMERIDP
ncbi:unnamed protein product [Vitrella brassicaformis CCMP3155]|uniref:Uncharacterized protein n=2 Tax=Vitrella brassicaformis TaxID=1169539 RepID=A0A0G4FY06_VITBC|nr:unnamed protein product [Vitrella brassicaformis CCMP3155]|eukprot:CEM19856.1 unnamed protein product [Vitrella brassicaformis CCMP3155]